MGTVAFVAWALVFIARSAAIAVDGRRYFSLFDDAMISMRYAWNLAHGSGLVWNPGGPRVEGYTNLLMTVCMALPAALLGKSMAVLTVQLAGIPTLLGIAWLTRGISRALGHSVEAQGWALVLSLGYYPLAYWTLMGMETGVLSLLLCASVLLTLRSAGNSRFQPALVTLLGMAFLTRPDALPFAGVLLAWRMWQMPSGRKVVRTEALLLGVVVLATSVFRLAYYDHVLPNTVTLKMDGFPMALRLRRGLGFILPLLAATWPMLLAAMDTLATRRRPAEILLGALVLTALLSEVWTGGDAWPYGRRLAVVMPFLLLVCLTAVSVLRHHRALGHVALCAGGLLLANEEFLPEALGAAPIYTTRANARNINTALAIEAVTTPTATVGVFMAGTLPYYTDRRAIDFLGKSDAHIAELSPDLAGSRVSGLPGHDKYDLRYSILGLRPTYVQDLCWGHDDLRGRAPMYRRYVYHGVALWLDSASDAVRWPLLAHARPDS